MSLDYEIRPRAREDIDNSYHWLESPSAGSGDRLLTDLADMIRRLRNTPELYAQVRGTMRAAPLPNSKYIVYYRVESNSIRVVAVRHASADPRSWQYRR